MMSTLETPNARQETLDALNQLGAVEARFWQSLSAMERMALHTKLRSNVVGRVTDRSTELDFRIGISDGESSYLYVPNPFTQERILRKEGGPAIDGNLIIFNVEGHGLVTNLAEGGEFPRDNVILDIRPHIQRLNGTNLGRDIQDNGVVIVNYADIRHDTEQHTEWLKRRKYYESRWGRMMTGIRLLLSRTTRAEIAAELEEPESAPVNYFPLIEYRTAIVEALAILTEARREVESLS